MVNLFKLLLVLPFLSLVAQAQMPRMEVPSFEEAFTESMVSPARVEAAFKLLDEKYFREFQTTKDGKIISLRESFAKDQQGPTSFDVLLYAYVSGLEDTFSATRLPILAEHIQKLSSQKTERLADRLEIAFKAAARDREIALCVSQYPYFLTLIPLEYQLLAPGRFHKGIPVDLLDIKTESTIRAAKKEVISFLSPRHQQAEMLRVILQYAHLNPNDRVLEIGYGTPAVMVGLSAFIPNLRQRGIDLHAIPERGNEALARLNIELFTGRAPDDERAAGWVKQNGPYSLIYAVDVISRDPEAQFHPKANPQQYAQWLYDNLEEGGTLIILNDSLAVPYFDENQAKAVGFQIVRPTEQRDFGYKARRRLFAIQGNPRMGLMALTVLRRGRVGENRVTPPKLAPLKNGK